ncbi:hypothetical protein EH223_12635 [candidate division KSB1 bacterium]|nr:hypothetical protein [candidate division KSB1 bacterium]RQW02395.1 MAG: hypothetical protein EH223_12635 [candidate division KSB1 bacterium]
MARWSWIFALFLIFIFEPLYSYIFRYDVIKGDKRRHVEWRILKKENDMIEFMSRNYMEDVSHRMELSPDLSTLSWSFLNPRQKIDYRVNRAEGELIFAGKIGDETMSKKARVSDLPWYQIHGYSLPEFLKNGQKEIEFFSVRPEDGKVFKLVAERKDVETVFVQEKPCRAIRVDVRLSGLLAHLGHVTYWFREHDLVFVKYQGMSGFPGSDPVVYELCEIKDTDSTS